MFIDKAAGALQARLARPSTFSNDLQPQDTAMLRRHWKMVLAILGGNFLYFVVLSPYLPQAAQHRRNQLDWGLLVDFWICLALYGLFVFPFRRKR